MNQTIHPITCASIETTRFDSPADLAWFAFHTAPMDNEPETGAHPYQTAALQTYLSGKSSPQTTVSILCTPQEQNPPESPQNLRLRVFSLLQSALFELPRRYTPSLITLLSEIHNLSDPTWTFLPNFATAWSDLHKQSHWREALATADPSTRDKRREAHIHRAFVEASCAVAISSSTSTTPEEEGLMPLSWGYECLSSALETQHAVWDFEIPAAAVWVKVAGTRFKEGAEMGERSWALEREGRLWGAGPMSLGRWEFWMRRFEEIEGLGNAISNAGSEGLRGMRRC